MSPLRASSRVLHLLVRPFGRSVPAYTRFGNAVLVAFLLVQLLDGALTYLGVVRFGWHEGNPLILWLIQALGEGPALASAKMFAGFCGIILHLTEVHRIIAVLTGFYLTFAVVPWTLILLTLW